MVGNWYVYEVPNVNYYLFNLYYYLDIPCFQVILNFV